MPSKTRESLTTRAKKISATLHGNRSSQGKIMPFLIKHCKFCFFETGSLTQTGSMLTSLAQYSQVEKNIY